MVAAAVTTKERERLRWQCRRGLRELDELLQPFLRCRYDDLDAAEMLVFRDLLACTDPDLLNYLMKNKIPEDHGWVAIIEKIRSCAAD
jgi:antitoxin CptB